MDHRGQALELGLVSWGCWGTVWGLQRVWQDCAFFADRGETLGQGLPPASHGPGLWPWSPSFSWYLSAHTSVSEHLCL